jgi:hypothetical protein
MILEATLNQDIVTTRSATVTVEVPDDFPTWSEDDKDAFLDALYAEVEDRVDFERDTVGSDEEVTPAKHTTYPATPSDVGDCGRLHFRVAAKGSTPEEVDLEGQALNGLSDELEAYCKAQGLVPQSADEMLLSRDLTPDQRRWLSDFVRRWDAASRVVTTLTERHPS